MLPRKPKISYRYLKSGIDEFHRKFVLIPADKAANSVVVTDFRKEKSVINNHIFHNAKGLL